MPPAVPSLGDELRPCRDARPRGTVYLWPDGVTFVGGDYYATPHERFAASLCIALDAPFRARYGAAGEWAGWHGSLVAQNVQREVDMRGTRVVMMLIDPESDAFARLGHLLGPRQPVHRLPEAVARRLAREARERLDDGRFDAVRFRDVCLDAIGSDASAASPIDPRVRQVLSLLKSSLPDVPTLPALAAAVGLSESRFIWLFNKTMGLSLRRYVQWLRLRHVAYCVAIGQTITAAAHEAGFADLAHLSRTFRSMFGLPISTFFGSTAPVELLLQFPSSTVLGPHGPQDRDRWETAARLLGAASSAESASPARRRRPVRQRPGHTRPLRDARA